MNWIVWTYSSVMVHNSLTVSGLTTRLKFQTNQLSDLLVEKTTPHCFLLLWQKDEFEVWTIEIMSVRHITYQGLKISMWTCQCHTLDINMRIYLHHKHACLNLEPRTWKSSMFVKKILSVSVLFKFLEKPFAMFMCL